MKPQAIKTDWHLGFSLDYRIFQNDESIYFVSTTKIIATKVLLTLFGGDPDGRLILSQIREIWNGGKIRTAEYAKFIIDATMNEILSPQVGAIAMAILTEQAGFTFSDDFMTERLVGKKRLQYWEAMREKYIVNFEDPTVYALLNMWGNGDKDLLAFIETNRRKINQIINECKY